MNKPSKNLDVNVEDIFYNQKEGEAEKWIIINLFHSKMKLGSKNIQAPHIKAVPYEKYKNIDVRDLENINEDDIEQFCIYKIDQDSRCKIVKRNMIDHPPHYNLHPSGVECIEINEWMDNNLGAAFKYVFRHRDKNKPIIDLGKAKWYINRSYVQHENRLLHYCTPQGQRIYRKIYPLFQKVWEAESCPITAEALEYIFKLQARRPDDEPTCGNLARNAINRIDLLIDQYKKDQRNGNNK